MGRAAHSRGVFSMCWALQWNFISSAQQLVWADTIWTVPPSTGPFCWYILNTSRDNAQLESRYRLDVDWLKPLETRRSVHIGLRPRWQPSTLIILFRTHLESVSSSMYYRPSFCRNSRLMGVFFLEGRSMSLQGLENRRHLTSHFGL